VRYPLPNGLVTYKVLEPTAGDPPALHDLVRGWCAVFQHYQWGGNGVFPHAEPRYGWLDRRKTQWAWPEVPEISATLLNDLEKAARSLLTPAVKNRGPPRGPPGPLPARVPARGDSPSWAYREAHGKTVADPPGDRYCAGLREVSERSIQRILGRQSEQCGPRIA
jgi:hypothetical protein